MYIEPSGAFSQFSSIIENLCSKVRNLFHLSYVLKNQKFRADSSKFGRGSKEGQA